MLPDRRQPADDLRQFLVADSAAAEDLILGETTLQVASEEALDRLDVVCAQHPPEVVVQLKVGGRRPGLTHCTDDVRAVRRVTSPIYSYNSNHATLISYTVEC